jgi:SnoaL-like protein
VADHPAGRRTLDEHAEALKRLAELDPGLTYETGRPGLSVAQTDSTTSPHLPAIRAAVEAWNRGDWDAALSINGPNAPEIDASGDRGEWSGVARGRGAVIRMWTALTDSWDSVRYEIDRTIGDGDQVVTCLTGHFAGRDGIEATVHIYWAWIFEDGWLVRLVARNELVGALEAARLTE